VKKGRHRRFEEARKLKQQGPEAFLPHGRNGHDESHVSEEGDDEFADLAAKYGAFDDDEDDSDESS
jgi:hypothetical protein